MPHSVIAAKGTKRTEIGNFCAVQMWYIFPDEHRPVMLEESATVVSLFVITGSHSVWTHATGQDPFPCPGLIQLTATTAEYMTAVLSRPVPLNSRISRNKRWQSMRE